MNFLKSKTLEQFIGRWLVMFSLILMAVVTVLVLQQHWNPWVSVQVIVFCGLLVAVTGFWFYRKVSVAFVRALLHIEAVKMEDYNQYAKTDFQQGLAKRFHLALRGLSEHLLANKSRYDQHAFLLYQLIDQLDTPMLVFNQKYKLTHANHAFTILYDQPWQMYRHASTKLLGLVRTSHGWQLEDADQQWQISESEFIDAGEAHHLLVFTNIDSAVRASQLTAWQQIIRVMGHEIRNSLTPVSSLAESLSDKMNDEREKAALAMISERCHHLQDFIGRYASLSQQFNLQQQWFNLPELMARLEALNPKLEFETHIREQQIYADQSFLEQVLINLCKNALEAGATKVVIRARNSRGKMQISVADDGHGFANIDNLFVPLFTTKPEGQGLGLSFCRNVIEQHQGSLKLENNPEKGVTVTLRLPNPVVPN